MALLSHLSVAAHQGRRRGGPSWIPLILILLASTPLNAGKQSERHVVYVAGTFTEIRIGCSGTLDARDPKGLLIACGEERLTIPLSAIVLSRIVESEQDAKTLGLADALITRQKGQQLIYIRTVEDMDTFNWLLLELPANYARNLVVYLIRMKENRDTKLGIPTK